MPAGDRRPGESRSRACAVRWSVTFLLLPFQNGTGASKETVHGFMLEPGVTRQMCVCTHPDTQLLIRP
jgi:hypothetical protein